MLEMGVRLHLRQEPIGGVADVSEQPLGEL
jgi:hypothetical protein